MQRSKMEPVKGCFGRELVVREALSDVIVILDAEYLAPELHVRQLVIALEYNQWRLQRRFLFGAQYDAAAAHEVDVQM